jgi:hydrogenase nickel incorporation protein HypA/HybF
VHEYALAEGVVATALQAAAAEGLTRITRVEVAIGQLQRIEEELFAFALRQVLPAGDPRLTGVEFHLRSAPARLRCRVCDTGFDLEQGAGGLGAQAGEAVHFVPEVVHAFLRCPACGSPDYEVREGRGVWIEGVEGEA